MIFKYLYSISYIFPSPSLWVGSGTSSIFKRSKDSLNSEFSFYPLLKNGKPCRAWGFMSLQEALIQTETQTASSSIWTWWSKFPFPMMITITLIASLCSYVFSKTVVLVQLSKVLRQILLAFDSFIAIRIFHWLKFSLRLFFNFLRHFVRHFPASDFSSKFSDYKKVSYLYLNSNGHLIPAISCHCHWSWNLV